MKKIFYYTLVLLSVLLVNTSCEKDEIGGTATAVMAGDWYVTADAIDADGKVVISDADLFGIGHFHLDTYNTASNGVDSMLISDNKNFWDFKNKIKVDLKTMTFSCSAIDNIATDSKGNLFGNKITIKDGKVLLGAAKTPSGSVADSIVFTVNFDDDTYPAKYGYAAYRVAGYRYTGLTNDD